MLEFFGVVGGIILIYSIYKFNQHEKEEKLFQRALGEIASGNYKEALSALNSLIMERTYWKDYNLRGAIYQVLGDYHYALKDYEKSIELQPNININGASYIGRDEIRAMKLKKPKGYIFNDTEIHLPD